MTKQAPVAEWHKDRERFYNPELAHDLEYQMNLPYSETDGPECTGCSNVSGFEYELTGFIQNDRSGIYVEKKCKICGTITEEGDGDFHTYYEINNEGICSKE